MAPITTYHCLCTQLLLATPYPLPTLPQRRPPALDRARILPLGKPPLASDALLQDERDTVAHLRALAVGGGGVDAEGSGGGADMEGTGAGIEGKESGGEGKESGGEGREGKERVQYSLLLNTTLDRRAVLVRREDGFEKRWVRRCGRCRTGVGYLLEEGGEVVYLLEEGLVETGRWS